MKWTFGLITDGSDYLRNKKIIESIYQQNIPEDSFEIFAVGGATISGINLIHIPFDERKKKAHITLKKNTVARKAKFDNVCLLHDYVSLDINWYSEFLKFGEDWSHCSCRIEHMDGQRGRDWCTYKTDLPANRDGTPHRKTITYIDYNDLSQIRHQYQSGQCYCIKKEWALRFPLDESKSWGMSEDVANALSCRHIWDLKINPKSIFRYLKPKDENGPWPPRTEEFNFKQNGIDM